MNIEVFTHASIKVIGTKTLYFDPYQFQKNTHDADYIFITHDHYDHYDADSIKSAMNENTILIVPTCLKEKAHLLTSNLIVVEPNQLYRTTDISFETIPAYNLTAPFHPKANNYVGYKVLLDGTYYYIMGDTDRTSEADMVQADICFVPIGGTYTMNIAEAASYINYIKPKKAIPIHYGSIVGDIDLGEQFKNKINEEIEVEILIK